MKPNALAFMVATYGRLSKPALYSPVIRQSLWAGVLTASMLAGSSAIAETKDDFIALTPNREDVVPGLVDTSGSPNLVGRTPDSELLRRRQTEEQSWYKTLGIGGDAQTETLFQGIQDEFASGGSWAYQIYRRIEREADTEDDPNFDSAQYLKDHESLIPVQHRRVILDTGSEREAWMAMQDIQTQQRAQEHIQRMGATGQLIAKTIAALPDIAAVLCGLALLSFPVKAVFRRTGRERPEPAPAGN